MPEGEAPLEPPPPAPHSDADPNYTVYTTDFDEEIRPRIWPNRRNWNGCAPIWTSSLNR
jgi:hypothetical protein